MRSPAACDVAIPCFKASTLWCFCHYRRYSQWGISVLLNSAVCACMLPTGNAGFDLSGSSILFLALNFTF